MSDEEINRRIHEIKKEMSEFEEKEEELLILFPQSLVGEQLEQRNK